jgi:hypothetical protein
MYLELSARQTGKTTRLIEHVIERLQNDARKYVAIIGMGYSHTDAIKKRFSHALPWHEFKHIRFSSSYMGLVPELYDTVYFDEFCSHISIPIIPNGYYSSTPTSLDNSFLRELINYNNGHYETYKNHKIEEDWINNIGDVNMDIGFTLKTFYDNFPPPNRSVVPEELFQM